MADQPLHDPLTGLTRDELFSLLDSSHDPVEWERVVARLADYLSVPELRTQLHALALASFLFAEYGAFGNDQHVYLMRLARRVAAEVYGGMPPVGPAHEVN